MRTLGKIVVGLFASVGFVVILLVVVPMVVLASGAIRFWTELHPIEGSRAYSIWPSSFHPATPSGSPFPGTRTRAWSSAAGSPRTSS